MASVISNTVSMLTARLLAPLFSFAIHVGIARAFGSETLGVYVLLLALLVIFQSIATAGLVPLLSRDMAADPERTVETLRRGRAIAT